MASTHISNGRRKKGYLIPCPVCEKPCKGENGLRIHTLQAHEGRTWSRRPNRPLKKKRPALAAKPAAETFLVREPLPPADFGAVPLLDASALPNCPCCGVNLAELRKLGPVNYCPKSGLSLAVYAAAMKMVDRLAPKFETAPL